MYQETNGGNATKKQDLLLFFGLFLLTAVVTLSDAQIVHGDDYLAKPFGMMELLAREYPQALVERYKIEIPTKIDGWELLQAAGRKRGFLVSGGEVDTERMAKVLLEEYRSCKLGTFTLERPEELA